MTCTFCFEGYAGRVAVPGHVAGLFSFEKYWFYNCYSWVGIMLMWRCGKRLEWDSWLL